MSLELTLGAGGETGPLAKSVAVRHFQHLALMAEFRNAGKSRLSALIHVSPMTHGDYQLEATDVQGNPVDLDRFGGCGTTSPLMDHEIFIVEPGATVRTPLALNFYFLSQPGEYRLRVKYEAHRAGAGKGAERGAGEKLKHLWTGTLHSDWVAVLLEPA